MAAAVMLFGSCTRKQSSVSDVMDKLVTRLYEEKSMEALERMDVKQAMALLSEDDIRVLSAAHWSFRLSFR